MSTSLIKDILATAGQPVSGRSFTAEQLQQAIKEKRVLQVHHRNVEGEVNASFGHVYQLGCYSVSKTFPPYIVFPKPIPRELRIRSSDRWHDIADVNAEFGIIDG